MSRIRANQITNQSADGAPTVQNGLVISGVTTSTTFSGSGASLTNLNASNIASGTVPTARLGSGTASSSTFLRGDSTFQTVNTDLVSDTSPQLGANLDTNTKCIDFGDSNTGTVNRLRFGASTDLEIFHNGTNNHIDCHTAGQDLYIRPTKDVYIQDYSTDDIHIKMIKDGAVELYHNDSKKIETSNTGAVVTGILTATTFVPTTGQLSHRNVIVNGGCIVAQRSTSSTSSGLGSVDRMKMSVTNTDQLAFAQNQTSDGPDGFKKCFEFDVTTAESALAVDELVYMRYGVEAQDLAPFYNANGSGKNFTLSFYVKAHQTGVYQVSIYKDDNGTRFITRNYTIAASGVWQRVVLNITGDTGAYPVNADNGLGFWIDFKLAAGTSYTSGGAVNSWGSFSNGVFAGGQAVNVLSNNNNYWRITGIQLELGDTATPFEHRSYGEELLRCKRYYQRSTDSSRGTSYDLATSTWHSADGVHSFSKHNTYYDFKRNFEVEMRVAPTLTIYGSSNQGDIHLEAIGVGSQQVDWNNNTTEVKTKGFLLRHIEDSVYTSGSGNGFGILAYTVDAEL